MRTRAPVLLLVVVCLLSGCRCAGGPGDECTGDDCQDGLVCDPATRTCRKVTPGTDASGGTDATGPGTDASGPGTDATGPGTDATGPGTDATGPGTDATGPGTDAAGTCGVPPGPGDPEVCFQTCASSADCIWVDTDCCCDCANGGGSIAINADYADEWDARQAATCTMSCMGVGCLTVYLCPPSPPTCGPGGTCG